jgi:hypothetical protein
VEESLFPKYRVFGRSGYSQERCRGYSAVVRDDNESRSKCFFITSKNRIGTGALKNQRAFTNNPASIPVSRLQASRFKCKTNGTKLSSLQELTDCRLAHSSEPLTG